MRTLIFLTAENANTTVDGKINIFGIFNQINAVQFPTVYARPTIVIKLGLELAEEPNNRKFTLYFVGEDANAQKIKMIEDVFSFPPRVGGLDPEHVMIFNVVALGFGKPGTYQFILHIDDHFQSSLSLYARQAEPPPQKILQSPPQLGA